MGAALPAASHAGRQLKEAQCQANAFLNNTEAVQAVPLFDDCSQRSFPATAHIVFVPIKTFVPYQQIQKRTAVLPWVNTKRIQQVAADIDTYLPDVAQLQFRCSDSAD